MSLRTYLCGLNFKKGNFDQMKSSKLSGTTRLPKARIHTTAEAQLELI